MIGSPRWIHSVVAIGVCAACGSEPDRRLVGVSQASRVAAFTDWSEPVSLGSAINTSFNDQQAALSKDGLTLYFASNRPEGPDDGVLDLNIWVSRRACDDESCPWEAPLLLGSNINSVGNDAGPMLSRDGHRLFFFSTRAGFGAADIWVAAREHVHDDFAWEAPVNLGPNINTDQVEGGPGFFENEDVGVSQLYFNRSPTALFGGDIYVSEQASDGSFGPAVPVAQLNTPATDQRPAVAPSGLELYLHSDRTGSMSFDIWVATRESVLEPWSPPANVGAPINTAAGEFLPFIREHGGAQWLYFTRNVGVAPAVDLDLFVSTRVRAAP